MTRDTWRAIRELLLCMYRNRPETLDLPVYFVEAGADDPEALASAVNALQGLDVIPWPAQEGIIIAEYRACELFARRANGTPFFCLAWCRAFDRQIGGNGEIVCAKAQLHTRHFKAELSPSQLVFGRSDVFFLGQPRDHSLAPRLAAYDFDDDIERSIRELGLVGDRAREFYHGCIPKGKFWRFGKCEWLKEPTDLVFVGRFTDACEVFSGLAALVTPCHYFVKASHPGFGSRRMRRHTRARPICCVISYDRLYRMYDKGDDREVAPHFRMGHIRHLWKAAGLNRFALPDSPAERLQLVRQHQVQRVYVHPAWVGDRQFRQNGIDYTVAAGEMPLPLLTTED